MVDFDVVELGETDHVGEGEVAPDFTRPLVNEEYWEDASLSSLAADGPVLLVFSPMDGAWPALYMWKELWERRVGDDLTVVGVSISTPYAHSRFIQERGMDYQLFSDPANEVAREYGVVHDLDGMTDVSEPRPAFFLLDADRVVEYAWVATEWPETPDYDELESEIARVT